MRHGEMRGKNRKHLHVVRREIIQLRAFEVHHADDAIFVNHRHGQLGARFGIDHAVARIERHVRHHDRARCSEAAAPMMPSCAGTAYFS